MAVCQALHQCCTGANLVLEKALAELDWQCQAGAAVNCLYLVFFRPSVCMLRFQHLRLVAFHTHVCNYLPCLADVAARKDARSVLELRSPHQLLQLLSTCMTCTFRTECGCEAGLLHRHIFLPLHFAKLNFPGEIASIQL